MRGRSVRPPLTQYCLLCLAYTQDEKPIGVVPLFGSTAKEGNYSDPVVYVYCTVVSLSLSLSRCCWWVCVCIYLLPPTDTLQKHQHVFTCWTGEGECVLWTSMTCVFCELVWVCVLWTSMCVLWTSMCVFCELVWVCVLWTSMCVFCELVWVCVLWTSMCVFCELVWVCILWPLSCCCF